MSITKQKLLNAIAPHPKLVILGIGLAITMAIGTAIGMLDPHQGLAYAYQRNANSGSNTDTGGR